MPVSADNTRRRRFRRLLVAAAVLAALGLAAFLYFHSRGSFAEFVGRDLRKLNDGPDSELGKFVGRFLPKEMLSEQTRFNKAVARTLPKELAPDDNDFGLGFQPWYIWRFETERGTRFVLLMGQTVFVIPGSSAARFVILDGAGSYIGHTDGSTGWRIDIVDAAVVDDRSVGVPVIEIRSAPVINGADIAKQHYALIDDRMALVRLENSQGSIVPNNYEYPNHHIGPPPAKRGADEWEALLESPELARVLEALTWIGGRHSAKHDPTLNVYQEDAESVRLIAELRDRPAVARRIAALVDSDHPWVREAAALAKDELAR